MKIMSLTSTTMSRTTDRMKTGTKTLTSMMTERMKTGTKTLTSMTTERMKTSTKTLTSMTMMSTTGMKTLNMRKRKNRRTTKD